MYAFFYYKKYLFLLKNVFVAFFYDAIAWTNFLIYSKFIVSSLGEVCLECSIWGKDGKVFLDIFFIQHMHST